MDTKRKLRPLIVVRAYDHASFGGWRKPEDCPLTEIEVVGWFIEETDAYIKLACDWTADDRSPWGCIHVIPKGTIIWRRTLKV